MDGIHDLGGMHGFGQVVVEPNEPPFHSPWEQRVFGLAMASMQGSGSSLSRGRAVMERIGPLFYLSSSYYELWMTAMATLLVDAGVVGVEELERRAGGWFPLSAPQPANSTSRPPHCLGAGAARFKVGDEVLVRDVHTEGHTRCPRYVRRRRGTVVRVDDSAPLPDLETTTEEEVHEAVYSVRFTSTELWGEGEGLVHVDLWDSYLDPP